MADRIVPDPSYSVPSTCTRGNGDGQRLCFLVRICSCLLAFFASLLFVFCFHRCFGYRMLKPSSTVPAVYRSHVEVR